MDTTFYVKTVKDQRKTYQKIKFERIRDEPETKENYAETLTEKLNNEPVEEERDVDTIWRKIKTCIIKAATETCGKKIVKPNQKRTRWWNDEIKESVKQKKIAWKIFKQTQTNSDREKYIKLRNETKLKIKDAKRETWENFGRETENNYKDNRRKFWTTLKRCRNRTSQGMRSILNNEGVLKTENEDILEEWRKYYETAFKEEQRETVNEPNEREDTGERITFTVNTQEHKRLLTDLDICMRSSDCAHTVQFYGAMFREGDVWICMEVMDTSLDKFYTKVYKNNRSIPENILSTITSAVLNALHYLHSKLQVIHRDVKPSNILINRAGDVKMCDFGISGYLVDSVAKTIDAGCKPYMAVGVSNFSPPTI
ncbi:hypothetical protein M8J75_013060 [Diaphorina citri]|nr:hypothetical protein M8J75_013060 [Diaphorina citri]